MINTSKNSSDRSDRSRRHASHTQREPHTQRSRSRSALSSPPRQSEKQWKWKVPVWVHCEKCFVTCDISPNLCLLACGHMFCRTCLHSDNGSMHIPCIKCNTSETHIAINDSLTRELHGMFHQSWMDPVLDLDVKQITFMMTKTQNYSKYLSKSVRESLTIPPKWQERQNLLKKTIDRIKMLKNKDSDVTKKLEMLKSEGGKVQKEVQMLDAVYKKAKAEAERKQQQQQQQQQQNRGQSNYRQDMKLVSSGRNEQSNQYIGQVKTPSNQRHRSENQNHSAPNIRNYSQRAVPPPRQNQSLDVPRTDPSRHTPHSISSARTAMPSVSNLPRGDAPRYTPQSGATFRPQPKNVYADSRRYEAPQHAPKRLVPSYPYDQYPNPSKRAAHYAGPDDIELNTSISSVGSSQILNPSRNYLGRPTSGVRVSSYK